MFTGNFNSAHFFQTRLRRIVRVQALIARELGAACVTGSLVRHLADAARSFSIAADKLVNGPLGIIGRFNILGIQPAIELEPARVRLQKQIHQVVEFRAGSAAQNDGCLDAGFVHRMNPGGYFRRRLRVHVRMNVDRRITSLGRMMLGNDQR